jgi:UDP-glucose 4-epimerase
MTFPLKRILVTGGAGFIGSHTVDYLLEQDKQVIVLDNLSSGKKQNLNLSHPNLEFIEGDILELPLLVDLVSRVDAVLHLAAIPSVQFSIQNPIYSFQVNVQGFLHVLESIRLVGHAVQLVYASSAAVYGNTALLPCLEEQVLLGSVQSPYALHKRHNEAYAELYFSLYGIPSVGLRYFNVYGLRQDPASPYSGVISLFLNAYRNGEAFTIFGDGLQSRDFVYISDVVQANWLALQNRTMNQFNVATGQPRSLLDLVASMEAAGKRSAHKQFLDERPGDIRLSYADVRRAKDHLKFTASVALDEGIRLILG